MLTLENVDAESPDIRVSDSEIHLRVLLKFRYLVIIHDLVGDLLNHPFGQFFSIRGMSLPWAFILGGAPVVRKRSEPSFSIIILSKSLNPIGLVLHSVMFSVALP